MNNEWTITVDGIHTSVNGTLANALEVVKESFSDCEHVEITSGQPDDIPESVDRKLRIRRRDPRNWAIEAWQEGGELISRGRYAGTPKKARWDTVNPIGYFPTLAYAAKRLLDEELGALWAADGNMSPEAILEALAAAEARVLAAVAEAVADANTTFIVEKADDK